MYWIASLCNCFWFTSSQEHSFLMYVSEQIFPMREKSKHALGMDYARQIEINFSGSSLKVIFWIERSIMRTMFQNLYKKVIPFCIMLSVCCSHCRKDSHSKSLENCALGSLNVFYRSWKVKKQKLCHGF